MTVEILPSDIPGCCLLKIVVFRDARGMLVKTFHDDLLREAGLMSRIAEQYWSVSPRGVLRGLHFQKPPAAHAKIVCCVEGEILDVVVDLRVGSPAYGRHALFTLTSSGGEVLHVPAGCAHGFLVLSERAVVVNNASTVHSPEHDAGIRWDSAGIAWPGQRPQLSAKDASLPALADYQSPFTFAQG